MKFVTALIIFFGLISSASASTPKLEIRFDAELIQGALVKGWTNATTLKTSGKSVDIDEQGRFVFGLGRDAEPSLIVTLLDADAQENTLRFNVAQRDYAVQKINGVESKYVSPPAEVSERIRRDSRQVKAARQTYRDDAYEYLQTAIWPAEGPITGVYGSQRVFNGVPKRPHYGLDIAGPVGREVIAPLAGKVTLAENDLYYSGGTLIVDHGRGVSSTFIHMSKLHVQVGDYVEQGQLIGEIGATGRVTGPHLDWRLNWFNVRLDPQLLLDAED